MEDPVVVLSGLYRELHDRFRTVVRGLSPEQLSYTPAEETNSIGVLVRHVIRSEGSMLGRLASRPFERDYLKDFEKVAATEAELLQELDEADRRLAEWAPLIQRTAIDQKYPRPVDRLITGEEWMVSHYGHLKEHIAHAELTRQLMGAEKR